jgi:hypothetical protein
LHIILLIEEEKQHNYNTPQHQFLGYICALLFEQGDLTLPNTAWQGLAYPWASLIRRDSPLAPAINQAPASSVAMASVVDSLREIPLKALSAMLTQHRGTTGCCCSSLPYRYGLAWIRGFNLFVVYLKQPKHKALTINKTFVVARCQGPQVKVQEDRGS